MSHDIELFLRAISKTDRLQCKRTFLQVGLFLLLVPRRLTCSVLGAYFRRKLFHRGGLVMHCWVFLVSGTILHKSRSHKVIAESLHGFSVSVSSPEIPF